MPTKQQNQLKRFNIPGIVIVKYFITGWWFSNCMKVNFNGNHELGIVWFDTDRGDWIHLKRTRISIKPSQIE